jgi:hypothetical protein
MELAAVALYGTAAVASAAAIVAMAIDRFCKIVADLVALVAGAAPWMFFLAWHHYIPGSNAVWTLGTFGSCPLFLLAFFLYGVGKHAKRQAIAAGASLVGVFAGLGFNTTLIGILSRME